MKRLFTLMLIVTMLVMSTSAVFASGNLPFEVSEMKVGLVIDGQIVTWDEDEYGRLFTTDKGRSMMPARIIAEKLGFLVGWEAETSTVSISKGENEIKFPLWATEIQTPNGLLVMEVPALPINGRTHVPVRFAAEALGVGVEWKSHKNVEGSNAYDYDYYVVLTTTDETVNEGSFGDEYWDNVHTDEVVVDIFEEASKVNKTYVAGGVMMVGADTILNSGDLTVYTGTIGQVEIQIKGWTRPGVQSTVKSLLDYWTGDDYAWNQLAVEFTETNDEWWSTPNGTQIFFTDEGSGYWIYIKK